MPATNGMCQLIKPGQRIVLRKHLPPAVCLYCHIIGEVPGNESTSPSLGSILIAVVQYIRIVELGLATLEGHLFGC